MYFSLNLLLTMHDSYVHTYVCSVSPRLSAMSINGQNGNNYRPGLHKLFYER